MILLKENNKIIATYNKKTNFITLHIKDYDGGKDFENAINKNLGGRWYYKNIFRPYHLNEPNKIKIRLKKGL